MNSIPVAFSSLLNQPRGRALLLGVVVVVALVLRCWEFNAVAVTSLKYEPDSRDKVKLARAIAFDDESPKYFNHPRLMLNTSAVLLRIGAVFGYKGKKKSARMMMGHMIALSVGTLLLIYLISLELFRDPLIGLTGALIYAVIPIGVVSPHYIKEDVPVMFYCTLAVLMLVKLLRTRNRHFFLWSGLCIGMAIGTKLTASVLVPIALLAYVIYFLQRKAGEKLLCWQLGVGLALIVIGFFAFNHQILLNPDEFLSRTGRQAKYAQRGHSDGTLFHPWDYLWTYQLRYGLTPGMTAGIVLASFGGTALILRRWREHWPAIVVLVWSVVFYLVVERSPAKPFPLFVRYVYPVIPPMVSFAALALVRFSRWAAGVFPYGRLAAGVIVSAVLLWPAAQSVMIVGGLMPDTRMRAADWVHQHVTPESVILLDGRPYSPRLDKAHRTESRSVCRKNNMTAFYRVDFLITNSFKYDRFFVNEKYTPIAKESSDCFRALFETCPLVQRFAPRFDFQTIGFHNPEIRIYDMKECGTVPL